MASTWSNLKFELIGTGDQSGTWGATTNDNLGIAIEQAIGGKADVTMSSTTITLTLTDTTALQNARALYLNLTGTPGGAATLEVPAVQKAYIVYNNTTGGFAVTVKVSGQTGVSVPNGKSMLLYDNGTDVVDAITHLSSLTLGSALPIASGGTGLSTTTAYGLIAAGTTSTGNFQQVSGTGTSGQVLTSNGAGALPTWQPGASGDVTAAGNNAFTGANTFYNATGQTFAQASTNDGIVLQGRAGGSSSYRVTFTTGTLSASRTVTLPNADINFTTGLGVANGGTGATTLTGVLKGNGTSAFTASNVNLSSEVTGTLPVANGGTGATTLTANNVILGNGTSAVQFVAPGTTGNVLVSNGTTWTSAAPAGAPNLQEFTSSGTWTKPSGATFVYVELWGAGGGGGSGRRGAAGTERSGGGGGGGGALARYMFRASDLGATVTVTLGTGGTAGAAQTSNDTNGANGANGGNTTFGSVLTAYGGGGGAGGGTTSGAGGSGGGTGSAGSLGSASNLGGSPSSTYVGGNGALGTNGTQNTLGGGGALSTASGSGDSGHAEFGGGAGGNRQSAGSSIYGSGGGGAGGWINSGNTAITGRIGGGTNSYTVGGTGAGSGGALGTAGTAGTQSTSRGAAGGGGGGGASITGVAGDGAAGGQGGGGGGGGGASLNGNNSGAGGAGGTGYCRVYTW